MKVILSLVFVVSALVMAACANDGNAIPDRNYDWCYEFDFAADDSMSLSYGRWYMDVGYTTDENNNLGLSYDAGVTVNPAVVDIGFLKAAAGDISVAGNGQLFGIPVSIQETIPNLLPAGEVINYAVQGGDAIGNTANVTIQTNGAIVLRYMRLYGNYQNPFGATNCQEYIDLTQAPGPTNTPLPTSIPTSTPGDAPTNTPTITLTPSNTTTPTFTPSWSPTPTAAQCSAFTAVIDFTSSSYSATSDSGSTYSAGNGWLSAYTNSYGDNRQRVNLRIPKSSLGLTGLGTYSITSVKYYFGAVGNDRYFQAGINGWAQYRTTGNLTVSSPYTFSFAAISASNPSTFEVELGQRQAGANTFYLTKLEVYFSAVPSCPTPTHTLTPSITPTPSSTPGNTPTSTPTQPLGGLTNTPAGATFTPRPGTPSRTPVGNLATVSILPTQYNWMTATAGTPMPFATGTWNYVGTPVETGEATRTPVNTPDWGNGGVGTPIPGEYGDITALGNNVFGSLNNALVIGSGWLGTLSARLGGIINAWYTAPIQAPPGIPLCTTQPQANEFCAILYVLRYTVLSGPIGSLIMPLATVVVDLFIVFIFIRMMRAILARLAKLVSS